MCPVQELLNHRDRQREAGAQVRSLNGGENDFRVFSGSYFEKSGAAKSVNTAMVVVALSGRQSSDELLIIRAREILRCFRT